MTPFIDVILVLLIIFMIAAPLATVDVPVDLPAATVKRQPRPDKPTFVTMTTLSATFMNHAPASPALNTCTLRTAGASASPGRPRIRFAAPPNHDDFASGRNCRSENSAWRAARRLILRGSRDAARSSFLIHAVAIRVHDS